MFVPMPVDTNAMVEELMAVPDRVGREQRKTQRGQVYALVISHNLNSVGKPRKAPRGVDSGYERLDGVPHCLRRVYRALSHLSRSSFVNRYLVVPFFRDPVTNADQFTEVDSSPNSTNDFPSCQTF